MLANIFLNSWKKAPLQPDTNKALRGKKKKKTDEFNQLK